MFKSFASTKTDPNRVGVARLAEMASPLGVSVASFFDEVDRNVSVKSLLLLDATAKMRLARAFARIENGEIRRRLVHLIETDDACYNFGSTQDRVGCKAIDDSAGASRCEAITGLCTDCPERRRLYYRIACVL